jgi:hypothetical protein
MHPSGLVVGVLLVVLVLWEAFETIVFPRIVSRKLRLTRVFYRSTWIPWRALGRRLGPGRRSDALVSVYGPMSLLVLLAAWAALLILGFALMHWGAGSRLEAPTGVHGFAADLYFSGASLFTLSTGDVFARTTTERVITIWEAATGLSFFALVIGYLPTLSQAFSRREVNISLLDARAGSPPSAGELLARHVDVDGGEALADLLVEWERWSAELLETHLSFPVLAFYRSQHDNQSWVAALTTILDLSALIIACLERGPVRSARLTFAMARHAAADLARVFRERPRPPDPDRLAPAEFARLREALRIAGLRLQEGPHVEEKLRRLREMYEPHMNALATYLLMPMPGFIAPQGRRDNWQSTSELIRHP